MEGVEEIKTDGRQKMKNKRHKNGLFIFNLLSMVYYNKILI